MARSEDWNQLNSSDFVRRSRFHFIKIGSCAVMVTLQHLHRFDRYLQLARQVDLPHRLKSIKPVHREQKRDALGEVGRSAENVCLWRRRLVLQVHVVTQTLVGVRLTESGG